MRSNSRRPTGLLSWEWSNADASGRVAPQLLRRLSDCDKGQVCIVRIHDHDQPFLKFLDAQGLLPGIRLSVEARDPVADLVSVRPDGGATIRMGLGSAAKILVRAE